MFLQTRQHQKKSHTVWTSLRVKNSRRIQSQEFSIILSEAPSSSRQSTKDFYSREHTLHDTIMMKGMQHYLQQCPTLCDPLIIAHQASLSTGFSRQEHWSELPCPPPGALPDLPRRRLKLHLYCLLCWQVGSLALGPPEKPIMMSVYVQIHRILTPQLNS